MVNSKSVVKARPFLKWIGGKTQILRFIQERIPYREGDTFTYIEPFIGSGAVLFHIISNYPNLKNIVINDINADLIQVYRGIADSVGDIIETLKEWEWEYHKIAFNEEMKGEYYYEKRSLFNLKKSDVFIQAALFIFLNKTCFNGLYRVNRKNKFNAAVGSYKKPMICDEDNLRNISSALQGVTILNGDFEETFNYAEGKTFFYLDPPYKAISKTANFNSYSKDQFNDNEQLRLKKFCDKISFSGHKWLLSNSDPKNNEPDNDFFDDLYREYHISRVPASRRINVNPQKRGSISELLITNNG